MVISTLGLGRAEIKRLHLVEIEKIPDNAQVVIGRVDKTTKEFERYKTIAGLSQHVATPEGTTVAFDSMLSLFTRDHYPTNYTKGVKLSLQATFTDQFNKLKELSPRFAKAYRDASNIANANLDNLGLTATTYGMNSEALYATSHSNGTSSGTGANANRPSTDIAFGPTAVQQMKNEIRLQKDARNTRMRLSGQVLVKVPIQLSGNLSAVLKSINLPGTANNDFNYAREMVDGAVVDDYTSATAWFARMKDTNQHGLFRLEQMPYDVMRLPLDEDLMWKWVSYGSFTVGWFIWQGTWGTTGS